MTVDCEESDAYAESLISIMNATNSFYVIDQLDCEIQEALTHTTMSLVLISLLIRSRLLPLYETLRRKATE